MLFLSLLLFQFKLTLLFCFALFTAKCFSHQLVFFSLHLQLTPFDLSILDIELPDLSGFDLIGHLRSRDPQARIIVNTMHLSLIHI